MISFFYGIRFFRILLFVIPSIFFLLQDLFYQSSKKKRRIFEIRDSIIQKKGNDIVFLWNQIVLSNFSFRYSIHFFPFARFILSIFEEEEKNFRNKRLDNLEERKWRHLGLFFIEYQILSNSFFFSSPTFFRFGGRSFPFARFTLSTSRKNSRSKTHISIV